MAKPILCIQAGVSAWLLRISTDWDEGTATCHVGQIAGFTINLAKPYRNAMFSAISAGGCRVQRGSGSCCKLQVLTEETRMMSSDEK